MKRSLLLGSLFLCIASSVVKAEPAAFPSLGEMISYSPVMTTQACTSGETLFCIAGVSSMGVMTLTTVSFKEVQEVKSDAINYAAGDEATPALVSVVNRVQEELIANQNALTFDQVIEAIVQQ
ncbi:MAG: hypothetical protein AB7I27_02895 [Bacteriovoracaceae bacterium]